jgi:hypothetical protein
MRTSAYKISIIALASLCFPAVLLGQGPGFHPSAIAPGGILTVDSHNTFYDSSDGVLSTKVALPPGATKLQFRATGGVITDGTQQLASADGLYASGQTPYNFTNTHFGGTYQGTPVGSTTGIDPALVGVFFSSSIGGTPDDSVNYRSDSGILPDLRTLAAYSPTLNQPFWIGDGYDMNNPFVTNSDAFVPPGTNQTYNIPAGAGYLLLGIGADIVLSDNQNAGVGPTAFTVHVFDNAVPEPATWILMSIAIAVIACGRIPWRASWCGVSAPDGARKASHSEPILPLAPKVVAA